MFQLQNKALKIFVIEFFLNVLDCDWIWIGLTIQKKWIEQQPAYCTVSITSDMVSVMSYRVKTVKDVK